MFQIIVMSLVYWAIFGLIIGLLAKWKNRNCLLWVILGGPFLVLGLLVITCMPFLCPKCRKKVKGKQWKKNICPGCGSNLKTGGKAFRTIIMVGSIPAVLIALFILTSSISMFVKDESSQKSLNYAESEASDPEVVKISKTDRIKLLKDKFFELVNTCEGFEKKEPSYKELIQWRVDLASLRDAVLVLFESSHACDTELEEIKVALVTMTQTFELIDTRNIERKDLMSKFDSVIKKLKEEAKIIISNPDNYSEEISKDFVNDYNIFINPLYGLESLNKRELGLFLDIARFYTDLFRSFAQIYDKKSNQAPQSKHSTDRAKKSINDFDIKGFKLGMTIEEATNVIFENLSDEQKSRNEIKNQKDCIEAINAEIKEIQQFYKVKKLYKEYRNKGVSSSDVIENVSRTIGITKLMAKGYIKEGYTQLGTKIIKTEPNINNFATFPSYNYDYGGIYIYGEFSRFSGEGFEVRFTNDEFGKKIYSIDFEVDLGIDAVDECESISKKAIKKYGEPTQKKKLLVDGELNGWSYCWGDSYWDENWRMENAKLLIYEFYRSWTFSGEGRLKVRFKSKVVG